MATRTSSQTGNWSSSSTWGGSAAPGAGDIAVISNGHVVTVDSDVTVGGTGIGHAVQINGSSSSSYGTLQVSSGITLTLRGSGTSSNTLMLIQRYGTFAPQAGSTIVGDPSADYSAVILNQGIISAIGSSGNPITFTGTSANRNWAGLSVSGGTLGVGTYVYDPENNIAACRLSSVTSGGPWIANAANTALGSAGDTSVSFGGSGASQFTTEKSSYAGITSSGDYFIDYDAGVVFFYFAYGGAVTATTVTYKALSVSKGWGIWSTAATTYNKAEFDYCVFNYMGDGATDGSNAWVLRISGHKTDGNGGTSQNFKVTNSTVQYCKRFLSLENTSGSSGDMIKIESNTIKHCKATNTGYGAFVDARTTASNYVSISSNNFNLLDVMVKTLFFGAVATMTGWKLNSNTGAAAGILTTQDKLVLWPNCEVAYNTLSGFSWLAYSFSLGGDVRVVDQMGGSDASNRAAIHDNAFSFTLRMVGVGSYLDFYNNTCYKSGHHGNVGSISGIQIQDVRCYNNLAFGKLGGNVGYISPFFEIGYATQCHYDNFQIYDNTVVSQGGQGGGFLDIGDSQDTASISLVTRLVAVNNLCDQSNAAGGSTKNAIRRRADSVSERTRAHEIQIDYNLDYGCSARYTTFVNQGTFALSGSNYSGMTSGRNVLGVSLHEPSAAPSGSKTLTLVVTSATDATLAWDGGSAVQLVADSGTATSGANTSSSGVTGLRSGTLTDSGKSWSTTPNVTGCPRCYWIKITGGTGSGQIRAITTNTATVLTTVPAWTTVPDNTSTYTIYYSEVTLTASDAKTVKAGIYLPELPSGAATYSDSSITYADHSVTGSDPLLTSPNGTTAASYQFSGSSPAKDAGSADYAAATDYWGTARPQGAAGDIGFYEFPIVSGGLLFHLRRMSGGFSTMG